jgi:tetratricopeptide (TPR) repeat protein
MRAEEEATDEVCASCGKAAVDDVKLKKCACKLIQYCSVECQRNHRPHHKKLCKKRLAKLRDDDLFTQPDGSHHGECPICCLPLPLDITKSGMTSCCCKMVCKGCCYANKLREREGGLKQKCLYCREPLPKTDEDIDKNFMKRAKANDPAAIYRMVKDRQELGDYEGAFEYTKKAAELGDMNAHFNLSLLYAEGKGVEKDMKKKVYHLEEAAIGGHPDARYNLGIIESRNGKNDRAAKHFIIAAKLGDDAALDKVKRCFMNGFVSKEDFEAALRGHQAAVDATKSKQREEAEERYKVKA